MDKHRSPDPRLTRLPARRDYSTVTVHVTEKFAGPEPGETTSILLAAFLCCSYNQIVYIWNEAKRKSNLRKHGLDFKDAYLVYENPDKCTYEASRGDGYRLMDVALAVVKGRLLSLVYTERGNDVRVISFRNASREERRQYEEDTK